jgi:predicted O-methyltransferase YrrM
MNNLNFNPNKNVKSMDYIFFYLRPYTLLWRVKHALLPNSRDVKASLKRNIEKEGNIYKFNFMNENIRIYSKENANGFIDETFINEQYKAMSVKEKAVLDIGAAIGDTAIYFSIKGAKFVEAYEPEEILIDGARKNLGLNNITNVTLFAQCASSKTIDEFAVKYKDESKVLKIDCEGGEYEMILKIIQ